MVQMLRRLSSAPPTEELVLFDTTPELPAAASKDDLTIIRRLGAAPLHRLCSCPSSWRQIVHAVIDSDVPGSPQRKGAIGFAMIGLTNYSNNQGALDTIKEMGGGVADYEMLVDSDRRLIILSTHYAMWQMGARFGNDPFGSGLSTQEPIPGLESPYIELPAHPEKIPEGMLLD